MKKERWGIRRQMKINYPKKLICRKAFSLVELIVSISIFLVFVIAITDVVGSVSKESRNSSNKQRAAVLAEEAIEASRNIRDANFANLADGTYGLSTSSNIWSFAGSSDLTDIFTRVLNISTINENQKKIEVSVSWADQQSASNSFSLSTYLTNWHTVLNLNAGLTVNKTVINHGGVKVASDFAPYQVGTSTVSVGVANTFPPGAYTITEANDSTYTTTFSGDCDGSGNITLIASSTNSCMITNEEKPSKLTVTKTVVNHGLSKIASDFTLLVDSNPVTSGALNTFNSGVHTVSETNDPLYTASFSGDCNSGGTVTLVANTTKTCTLTNTEKLASIIVNKTVINHGGSKIASNFAPFKVGATTVTLGATTTLDSGSYVVSETVDPAYTQSFSGDCSGTSSVTLVSGTTKTCTITNEQILVVPSITTVTPTTSITRTTATSGGNVTSDGGASVTARGVVWSTSINPTTALATKTSDGTGTGSFSSSITSLTCNTLYHVRAYATNSVGTNYGSDVTFTTSACSAITFVGRAMANGTSVTIPAHNVGDLLVVFAYRSSSNAAPTVPAGWTTINASGGSNNSTSVAYRIATGADTATGWSNATQVIVQIYRGVSASPIGSIGTSQANGQIVTYPTIALSVTNGTSWVIGSAGAASNSSTVEVPPTGMTMRSTIVGTSAEASGHDTNGGVSSWTDKTVTISASNVKWSARTLEIKSQ